MIRKTIFWIHLTSGVIAGLVIFSMSFTGVVLTYERQINNWVAESHFVPVEEQTGRLSLEELVIIQKVEHAEVDASSVVITNNPGAPITFSAGRRGGIQLNPYTGEEMETANPALEQFFRAMTSFHRWFSVEGENRDIARQVTGISNLAFLFLVLSGLYLWLPRLMKWALLKVRLLFRGSYPNSKARDFHWHHIFGIWSAIPLIAIVYTGAMFYYPWASNLVYSAFGVEAPVRGFRGPPPGANPTGPGQNALAAEMLVREEEANYLSLASVVEAAVTGSNNRWNRLTLAVPTAGQEVIDVDVDWGNGAQAHKRQTLSINRATGDIMNMQSYSDTPLAQKIGGIRRFLHTGELFGFWGQTIAGLVSLATLFMVWTGFALSYRRLIQPLFRKKA